MTGIEVRPASAVPDAAEAVLDTPGDGRTCWCQWFRLSRRAFDAAGTAERRERFRLQARAASPGPGVVAFAGDEPVGWCAVAPREEYPVVGRSKFFAAGPAAPGSWVVTCFVVPPEHRRQGVAHALLAGAVEHARTNGASVLDAAPVDVAAGATVGSGGLYHGTVSLFTTQGFEVVARPSPTRAIVRRVLASDD